MLNISESEGGEFLYPRSKRYSVMQSWDRGSVAISDTSEGIGSYIWESWTDGDTIYIKREGATAIKVVTDPLITEIDLTFDQNMRPCIVYVSSGVSKMFWYDTALEKQTTTTYPDIRNPRVSLDDKRTVNTTESNIIFSYVRDNNLYYRLQRDRYSVEYLIVDESFRDKDLPLSLNKIGMGVGGRFLFETNRPKKEVEESYSVLQKHKLAYPEAAWIASCGNEFPSRVQWLYKYLAKVDVLPIKDLKDRLPDSGYPNTTSTVMKDIATVGSGKTSQGVLIHEQVSLDWVKWAISQRVWKTLYTQNKINATQGGIDLIVNEIKYILDIAVEQGIFTQYKIGETKLDRNTNNLQVKFKANLTHTILEVEVNGSLKY